MKVLVLGATGMLGHQVYLTLRSAGLAVKAAGRRPFSQFKHFNIFKKADFIENVDLTNSDKYLETLNNESPDVIVNCAGATTRKLNQFNTSEIVLLNSVLPHRLSEWCEANDAKLIHISTDCVFEGEHAPYTEMSPTEAQDTYGMSKALGEVKKSGSALTLRTSIIGPELEGKTELFEWILSQRNQQINGYKNVIYSGVTTIYLSEIISKLVTSNSNLFGLVQVSSKPISKFDLIEMINQIYDLNIDLIPNFDITSNKTLSREFFLSQTGLKSPSWSEQINQMKFNNLLENQIARTQ